MGNECSLGGSGDQAAGELCQEVACAALCARKKRTTGGSDGAGEPGSKRPETPAGVDLTAGFQRQKATPERGRDVRLGARNTGRPREGDFSI